MSDTSNEAAADSITLIVCHSTDVLRTLLAPSCMKQTGQSSTCFRCGVGMSGMHVQLVLGAATQ